jgi:5'-3' exonuclease
MGIRNFYNGFKKLFSNCMKKELPSLFRHDFLLVELNGFFYNSIKLMYANYIISNKDYNSIHFFELISQAVLTVILNHLPQEGVFIVCDGIPPMMKTQEQIRRRYKNCIEDKYETFFDLNNLSPGTKTLHYLTKYIDWFLKKKITTIQELQHLDIYFSNEKTKGEGEEKCLRFIYTQVPARKKILIHSSDSDWLSISTLIRDRELYILRNINLRRNQEYVCISELKKNFIAKFSFSSCSCLDHKYSTLIDIYILFLFCFGNDYLPKIHSSLNFDSVMKVVMALYQKTKKHLFDLQKKEIAVKEIITMFASLSSKLRINKTTTKSVYTQQHKFLCFEYLFTIQNILNMNLYGNFDWEFSLSNYQEISIYHFQYIPEDEKNITFITNEIKEYQTNKYISRDILYHLMLILPRKSARDLLPSSLLNIPKDLIKFYPKQCIYDSEFTMRMIGNESNNIEEVYKYYQMKKEYFTEEEKKRNLDGKCFRYNFQKDKKQFVSSYYGNIEMKVDTTLILL